MKRIHVIAEGKVQGVGYRMYVQEVAERVGVKGWVRNLSDGTVEVIVEGEDLVVQKFIEELYARNSRYIKVDQLAIIQEGLQGERGFAIRR